MIVVKINDIGLYDVYDGEDLVFSDLSMQEAYRLAETLREENDNEIIR